MPEPIDENLIVQYLLGQLPEDDEKRFEERVFADRDQLQTIRAVERDLIDEYARGELSESERKQFEHLFVKSPARRNRIAFARFFREALDEPLASSDLGRKAAPPSPTPRKGLLAFWRIPGWPRYALAALAVVAVLGGAWLIAESLRRPASVPPQQAGTQPSAPEPGASPVQPAQTGATPEQALNPQPSRSPSVPEKATPQPAVVALVLSPRVARSSGNLAQLVIHQGATAVQLRLRIDREETYKEFRAELQTASGKPIKAQDALRARSTRAGRTIIWQVPSALFDDEEYELALSGKSEQGRLEPVAYYYFKVVKK
jgi:hypothetical protein